MEKQTFSEIYGLKKEEIIDAVGAESTRRMAWEYLLKFPHVAKYGKLRKSRGRMMIEALQGKIAERGNIRVELNPFMTAFRFLYRGTVIMEWVPFTDETREIYAGEFEDTTSTRNQRKMAREAIEEFNRVVLEL